MLKLLFQKLQIRPILAPGRDSRPPGTLLKTTAWGQVEASSGGIQAIVFQGETDTTLSWEQLTAQGETAAVFLKF